jgi:hypothetical protein
MNFLPVVWQLFAIPLKLFFKTQFQKPLFSIAKTFTPATSNKNAKMQIVPTVGRTVFQNYDSIAL